MPSNQNTLPKIAERFLAESNSSSYLRQWNKTASTALHAWMKGNDLKLSDLNLAQIIKFVEQSSINKRSQITRRLSALAVDRYLYFLNQNGKINFAPDYKPKPEPIELPDSAKAFLRTIELTLRPNTCAAYTVNLKDFYRFLVKQKIPFSSIDREHIVAWLSSLKNRGLAPATKEQKILTLKLYLDWLYDQELIAVRPARLVLSTDLPKLPQYLPRPLSPQDDRALQKDLETSKELYHMALLLMRYTGVRVGELLSLPYGCVREDHLGFSYLKVPLGKLNSERLVPLDQRALDLILKIKKTSRRKTIFLIVTPTGKRALPAYLNKALKDLCEKLNITENITCHQLRHTLASSLLSAGMSIFYIKEILGHRTLKMTLRYLRASPEDIAKEFLKASSMLQEKYEFDVPRQQSGSSNPAELVADAIRLLTLKPDSSPSKEQKLIVRRLERIKADLQRLTEEAAQ